MKLHWYDYCLVVAFLAMNAFFGMQYISVQRMLANHEVLEDKTADRWKGEDMKAWREELQRLNPMLKVPPTK